jgi:hypothetical protein
VTTELEPDYTDIPLERVPPQDFDAEQGALGACLLTRTALREVRDTVDIAAFYQPRHQLIFAAILHMDDRGLSVDQITLAKYLADTGDLIRVGGSQYLYELTRAVPTAANGEYYAEIVQDRGLRRALIELATRMAQAGYNTTGETRPTSSRSSWPKPASSATAAWPPKTCPSRTSSTSSSTRTSTTGWCPASSNGRTG